MYGSSLYDRYTGTHLCRRNAGYAPGHAGHEIETQLHARNWGVAGGVIIEKNTPAHSHKTCIFGHKYTHCGLSRVHGQGGEGGMVLECQSAAAAQIMPSSSCGLLLLLPCGRSTVNIPTHYVRTGTLHTKTSRAQKRIGTM